MSDAFNDRKDTVKNFRAPQERPVWAKQLRTVELDLDEVKAALRSNDDFKAYLRLTNLAKSVEDLLLLMDKETY
jgi:hypothetical protein